jgi:hypothetical protein
MAGIGFLTLLNEPSVYEVFDSLREKCGRNTCEAVSKFNVSTRRKDEEIAQYQKCPAVTHEVEGLGDGAVHVVTALRGGSGFRGSRTAHVSMVHFLYQKGKS